MVKGLLRRVDVSQAWTNKNKWLRAHSAQWTPSPSEAFTRSASASPPRSRHPQLSVVCRLFLLLVPQCMVSCQNLWMHTKPSARRPKKGGFYRRRPNIYQVITRFDLFLNSKLFFWKSSEIHSYKGKLQHFNIFSADTGSSTSTQIISADTYNLSKTPSLFSPKCTILTPQNITVNEFVLENFTTRNLRDQHTAIKENTYK